MPDHSTSQGSLQIPADTQTKFGDLVKLIQGSESMNMEERQYWINILPIMTDEQLTSLRDILENEKKQLAEIDRKYAEKVQNEEKKEVSIQEIGEKIRTKGNERKSKEAEHEKQEEEVESSILERIRNM